MLNNNNNIIIFKFDYKGLKLAMTNQAQQTIKVQT
jgi:hypothetical protein